MDFIHRRNPENCAEKEGFTRHIHVPRPSGGAAVQNGNPAVLSLGHPMVIALRAATPCKTAVLPFCHSAIHCMSRPPGGAAVQNGCPAVLSNRRNCEKPDFPQNKKTPHKGAFFILAEKEGFEPSMGVKAHTPLAGEPLRPLGHLSKKLLHRVIPDLPKKRSSLSGRVV